MQTPLIANSQVPKFNLFDNVGKSSGFFGQQTQTSVQIPPQSRPTAFTGRANMFSVPTQTPQQVAPVKQPSNFITKQEVFYHMDRQGFSPEKQKEFLKGLVSLGYQVEGLNAQSPDLGIGGSIKEGVIGAFRAGEQIPSIAGNVLGFTARNITGPAIAGVADLFGANEFADKWRTGAEKFGKGAEKIGEDITMAGMTDGGTNKLTENQINARKTGGQLAITAPIGGEYLAGSKGILGMAGRGGVVGAGFGASQPIIDKGGDATLGDIAQGGAYGAGAGALLTPVIGKVVAPVLGGVLNKTVKYGTAGYYGGAEGVGKSIARDVSGIKNSLTPDASIISTKANRFSAGDIRKFKETTGQTPGEFATSRGMTKVGNEAVDESLSNFQASKQQADEAIGLIKGEFRYNGKGDDALKTSLVDLTTRLKNTQSKDAGRFINLLNKYEDRGLTMAEVNEIKRAYANNFKYSFADVGSESLLKSRNLQDAIRNWQFKVAKENGFQNLNLINKETQGWKAYTDSLAKNITGQEGNNGVTITDWISLSGGTPENVALFLGKKAFTSNFAKRKAIELFAKPTRSPIIKADKASILQNNFKKDVNRGISSDRSGAGGESMVRPRALIAPGSKEALKAQEEAIARQEAKKASTEQAKAILVKQKANEEALKSPDITSKSIIRQPEGYTPKVTPKKVAPTPVKEVTPKKITPTEKVEPKKVETNITRNEAIEKGFSDSAKARWNKGEFTSKERGTATTYLKSNYKGKEYTIDGKKYKVKSIDNRNEQVNLEDSNGNILRVKTNKLPETKVTDSDISNYYNGRLQKGYRTIKDPTKTTVNLQQSKGGFIKIPEIGKKSVNNPLVEEARKYKSAEEFIKNKTNFVHETSASDIKEFDMNKIGSGQGESWLGRGIYMQEKGSFKIEKYGDNKVMVGLTPEAKIFKIKETPEGKWRDNFIEWFTKKEPRFEGSLEEWRNKKNVLPRDILMNRGKGDKVIDDLLQEGYDGILQDGELVIFNPKVLKTEYQLRKIYEQSKKSQI